MADSMQDPFATQYEHAYTDVGLGIDLVNSAGDPGYHRVRNSLGGTGALYYDANSSRSSSPFVQASPPTPHSTASDAGVQTRSGRKPGVTKPTSQSRTSSRTRMSKSPKPARKASKASKSEKLKIPKLTEPISVLTRGMDVPVKDMDAWVNRSAEVRRKEVEDRKGYVTRPMNSFMLYRSAYAERLKQWGVHNNHQVVSSMAGESWPLEPPEIREHYNELAKLERTNHQNAHPNYKFSPSKTASPKKRKGSGFESDEEDVTDVDDPDAEWGAGRRQRSTRQKHLSDSHMTMASPFVQHAMGPDGSMWEASVEGKPLPQAMSGPGLDHRYYPHAVYPPYAMPTIEEVRARQLEHHGASFSAPMHHSLVGLPGGQHHDLLQPMSVGLSPPLSREVPFDPHWMGYFSSFADGMAASYETGHPEYPVPSDFLGTGQGNWQVDPSLQTLDAVGHSEGWMESGMH